MAGDTLATTLTTWRFTFPFGRATYRHVKRNAGKVGGATSHGPDHADHGTRNATTSARCRPDEPTRV